MVTASDARAELPQALDGRMPVKRVPPHPPRGVKLELLHTTAPHFFPLPLLPDHVFPRPKNDTREAALEMLLRTHLTDTGSRGQAGGKRLNVCMHSLLQRGSANHLFGKLWLRCRRHLDSEHAPGRTVLNCGEERGE